MSDTIKVRNEDDSKGDDGEKIRDELSNSVRIALEVFCEIIDQWNDAVADGDRGRRMSEQPPKRAYEMKLEIGADG